MIESPNILTLTAADTGYDNKQVLFSTTIDIRSNKITALIGPNGAGKSTILRVAHGLLPLWSGSVTFYDTPLNGLSPAQRVRKGITLCPQGNRVFGELTVRENIGLGCTHLSKREASYRTAAVIESFPKIATHLDQTAGTLSGGEQQMVSIARALVSRPKLLMLDEPSLGLSPNVINEVLNKIVELNRTQGVTILIVEQKVRKVLKISDHVYALKLGKVSFSGSPNQLINKPEKLRKLFQ